MSTRDNAARSNFLANLGNILIQFVIEQNKKAEADSQATKPEQSATAKTLAENLQVKEESTTKRRDVKNLADQFKEVTEASPEQAKNNQPNSGVADINT